MASLVWTDGSATAGVLDGGAGALIEWPDGEVHELRTPAGHLCSSYRAEMVALQPALTYLLEHPCTRTTRGGLHGLPVGAGVPPRGPISPVGAAGG